MTRNLLCSNTWRQGKRSAGAPSSGCGQPGGQAGGREDGQRHTPGRTTRRPVPASHAGAAMRCREVEVLAGDEAHEHRRAEAVPEALRAVGAVGAVGAMRVGAGEGSTAASRRDEARRARGRCGSTHRHGNHATPASSPPPITHTALAHRPLQPHRHATAQHSSTPTPAGRRPRWTRWPGSRRRYRAAPTPRAGRRGRRSM